MKKKEYSFPQSIGEWILVILCIIDGFCTLILFGMCIGIFLSSSTDNRPVKELNSSQIQDNNISESDNHFSSSSIDLSGVWTGSTAVESYDYIQYLYFSSDSVYYMASKVGKPSPDDFTNKHKIAGGYTISRDNSGQTICTFSGYTVTVDDLKTIHVSGKTISGTYHR